MTQKTPFEVRADLLKQAQELLLQQYNANLQFASQAWQKYLESIKNSEVYTTEQWTLQFKQMQEAWQQFIPEAPTFQDVITKAQELYGFVQKKD
jgi:hypothetical protein